VSEVGVTEETPFQRFVADAQTLANARRYEMGVPMRDGIELAADIYLPAEADQGPVPAIVQVTPYDKSNVLLTANEGRYYQSHGYAYVAVDCRGRGKSEGEWNGFANDVPDTHDVIEWVAAQRWCDEKVGTTGISYMGWVQWAGASESPPHLKAMVSTSAAGRWQQEIPYTNGIFQLYFAWWAHGTRRRIDESYRRQQFDWDEVLRRLPFKSIGEVIDTPTNTWNNLADRDTLDDFWKNLRFDDRYDQINVPCLHVTGWYDQEDLLGAFHHYELMREHSPATDEQYLIVGPWSHLKSRFPDRCYADVDLGPAAAMEMDNEHLRWFDYWLKGEQNGVDAIERVRVFEPGTNIWRTSSRWPLADSTTTLYLGPGTLGDTAPDAPSRIDYSYNPLDPVPTGIDVRRYPVQDVPLDQTENETRADVVSFTSEALAEALTISGWAHFEFYGSSNCDDTDWHVKITDVTPEGRSNRVTQGCLRAAARDSLEVLSPLVPDDVYFFDVEMWPTHHVFLPGHRLRVTVTSSDFPWYARSLNHFGPVRDQSDPRVAINSIHGGGQYPSRITLPVETDDARRGTP
jgi:putative CocE/NonD family hydrolase